MHWRSLDAQSTQSVATGRRSIVLCVASRRLWK
jgi:hypothetical protein